MRMKLPWQLKAAFSLAILTSSCTKELSYERKPETIVATRADYSETDDWSYANYGITKNAETISLLDFSTSQDLSHGNFYGVGPNPALNQYLIKSTTPILDTTDQWR